MENRWHYSESYYIDGYPYPTMHRCYKVKDDEYRVTTVLHINSKVKYIVSHLYAYMPTGEDARRCMSRNNTQLTACLANTFHLI